MKEVKEGWTWEDAKVASIQTLCKDERHRKCEDEKECWRSGTFGKLRFEQCYHMRITSEELEE